jgi:hypothetical protein
MTEAELRERGEERALLALRALQRARMDFCQAGDREAAEHGKRAATDIARALYALDGAGDELELILDPAAAVTDDFVPSTLQEALSDVGRHDTAGRLGCRRLG